MKETRDNAVLAFEEACYEEGAKGALLLLQIDHSRSKGAGTRNDRACLLGSERKNELLIFITIINFYVLSYVLILFHATFKQNSSSIPAFNRIKRKLPNMLFQGSYVPNFTLTQMASFQKSTSELPPYHRAQSP